MKGIAEKNNAELRLLYQICIDDIEHTKSRQWATIFYVLLALAATVGFYNLTRTQFNYLCWNQKFLLLIPAFFISLLGMWILMDAQKSLCVYRMRILAIMKKFGKDAQGILEIPNVSLEQNIYRLLGGKEGDYPSFDRYFWFMVFPFILLMMTGLFFVALLLLTDKWSWKRIFISELALKLIFFVLFYCYNRRQVSKAKSVYMQKIR